MHVMLFRLRMHVMLFYFVLVYNPTRPTHFVLVVHPVFSNNMKRVQNPTQVMRVVLETDLQLPEELSRPSIDLLLFQLQKRAFQFNNASH